MNIFSSIDQYRKIVTDSRKLKAGDIFLALRGNNFDGHEFINQALKNNVELVFSEEAHHNPKIKLVKNTLETYHQLAKEYRRLVNPIVIAITGSSGKTTLKELLIKVLETKYKVHATQANFNNEIGVPQTILSMPEDTEVLIVEMGMRGLGEIELLSQTAEPDIAIITNIGTAHIERLGSIEKIREAKLEITKGIRGGATGNKGKLIVDSNLYETIKNSYPKLDLISFSPATIPYSLPTNQLTSIGLLASINAAIEVAKILELSQDQIQEGLQSYQAGDGRGRFIYKDGNLFIDETYNSNPEAVRNSVYAMLKQFPEDHKIAVLGDIKESQPKLVDELFSELASLEDLVLIDARSMNPEQAKELLKSKLKTDCKNVVLVKASRSAKFENIFVSSFEPPASSLLNATH